MAPPLVSVVRSGVRRHLQPRKGPVRVSNSIEFKREVCRIAEEERIKGLRLQEVIQDRLHWKLSLSTLHGILKGKAEWNAAPSLATCKLKGVGLRRDSKVKELEEVLREWAYRWVRRHGTLTYALLEEKALKKGQDIGIPTNEFKASSGWKVLITQHLITLNRS